MSHIRGTFWRNVWLRFSLPRISAALYTEFCTVQLSRFIIYTVCTVHCTVYTVQFAVYSVKYVVQCVYCRNFQCAPTSPVWTMHFVVHSLNCEVCVYRVSLKGKLLFSSVEQVEVIVLNLNYRPWLCSWSFIFWNKRSLRVYLDFYATYKPKNTSKSLIFLI